MRAPTRPPRGPRPAGSGPLSALHGLRYAPILVLNRPVDDRHSTGRGRDALQPLAAPTAAFTFGSVLGSPARVRQVSIRDRLDERAGEWDSHGDLPRSRWDTTRRLARGVDMRTSRERNGAADMRVPPIDSATDRSDGAAPRLRQMRRGQTNDSGVLRMRSANALRGRSRRREHARHRERGIIDDPRVQVSHLLRALRKRRKYAFVRERSSHVACRHVRNTSRVPCRAQTERAFREPHPGLKSGRPSSGVDTITVDAPRASASRAAIRLKPSRSHAPTDSTTRP